MTFFQDGIGVTVNWNFFATSHGKGAVDGIGGVIKHLMRNKIKSRNIIIQDAKEFATAAQKLVKTTVIYIEKLQIESNTSDLDRSFKDILPEIETHKMHFFHTVQKGTVEISRTSKINGTIFNFKANDSIFSKTEKNDDSQPEELKVSIGHWVVVRFLHENSSRTKDFIGQVTSVVNNSAYIVLFTKKCGKNLFLFPKKWKIELKLRKTHKLDT